MTWPFGKRIGCVKVPLHDARNGGHVALRNADRMLLDPRVGCERKLRTQHVEVILQSSRRRAVRVVHDDVGSVAPRELIEVCAGVHIEVEIVERGQVRTLNVGLSARVLAGGIGCRRRRRVRRQRDLPTTRSPLPLREFLFIDQSPRLKAL